MNYETLNEQEWLALLTVVVGVILSLFTKENFYVYLTYFMVIYNIVITLSMVDDLEELKKHIKSKDTE